MQSEHADQPSTWTRSSRVTPQALADDFLDAVQVDATVPPVAFGSPVRMLSWEEPFWRVGAANTALAILIEYLKIG